MCVAIVKPEGVELPEDIMRDCWEANPHGAGFMFAHKGEVVIRKGFMRFRHLKKAWRNFVKDHGDILAVVHFRISTSGATNAAMTHPHRVHERLAMVHNGILPSHAGIPLDSPKSDTALLAEFGLKHAWDITTNFINVEAWAGPGNKIAMLGGDGELVLLNKPAWKEYEGLLFSNFHWLNVQEWIESPADLRFGEDESIPFKNYEDCIQCGEWFDPECLPFDAPSVHLCLACCELNMVYTDEKDLGQ